jgi:hypothetical protein
LYRVAGDAVRRVAGDVVRSRALAGRSAIFAGVMSRDSAFPDAGTRALGAPPQGPR